MMNVYYLTFRSVTPAQRGENLLQKKGFRCVLQRTPRWMEEKGCGYCLRLPTDRIQEAARMLQRAGIPFRKVYLLDEKGNAEEISI